MNSDKNRDGRTFLWTFAFPRARVPQFFLRTPAFLFRHFFAFPCALAFLFRVPMLLCQRVYVGGGGATHHTRAVCSVAEPEPVLFGRSRSRCEQLKAKTFITILYEKEPEPVKKKYLSPELEPEPVKKGPGQLATSPLPPLVTRTSILAGSRFGVKPGLWIRIHFIRIRI